MITGFGKYLIDNGFKRYRYEWHGHGKEKKQVFTEDYETESVSSLGMLEYTYRRDNVWCYWGLNIKGHSPKFFIISNTGKAEDDYFNVSDYVAAVEFLIEHCAIVKRAHENATEAIKRLKDLPRRSLKPQ